ncbi:MFS transporter [Paenibacillus tritici]|uniref:MFS transporter n=1 Tax=Paenibacillus tritici TaxID=1873425 RepID=A0ABX2DTY7_9BACL|nr:MFS transporter [Paenibacillus tritici]NQX48158.1 MFS transporter [Paenibacillus tritici]
MTTWFLIIIYLAFISLGLPDSLLGSAWPVIWPEMGSSLGSAGIISMIIAGGTIVSSLFSNLMVERLGTGRITFVSCLLTAASLFGFSVSPSVLWFIVMAIPLGLGAGAVDAALNHYVAAYYKAHHMSWLHCFWGVGATLGPMIMAVQLASPESWRGGYAVVAAIQFLFAIILLVTLPLWKKVAATREPLPSAALTDSAPAEATPAIRPQANTIRLRGVRPTLLTFLLYCGIEAMVGLWGASYLVGSRGVAPEKAAVWISLYYAGITVGRLTTGFITLKVPNRLLIRYGQLLTITGGVVLLLPLHPSLSLAGLILIGLGLAPIYPGLLHETPARFGRENSARLIGYQMAVAYTGTTVIPPLFGLLSVRTGIGVFPFTALALLLLMFWSAETVNRLLGRSALGRE